MMRSSRDPVMSCYTRVYLTLHFVNFDNDSLRSVILSGLLRKAFIPARSLSMRDKSVTFAVSANMGKSGLSSRNRFVASKPSMTGI